MSGKSPAKVRTFFETAKLFLEKSGNAPGQRQIEEKIKFHSPKFGL